MMWGYGWTGPMLLWMGLGSIFWLTLLGLVVWALVRWLGARPVGYAPRAAGPSAMEILQQRYARGELDAATFDQMRERLEATAVYKDESHDIT